MNEFAALARLRRAELLAGKTPQINMEAGLIPLLCAEQQGASPLGTSP